MGTPVEEVIHQCRGIQEMQAFFNVMPNGASVPVTGIGDGIAHVLLGHLQGEEALRPTSRMAALAVA